MNTDELYIVAMQFSPTITVEFLKARHLPDYKNLHYIIVSFHANGDVTGSLYRRKDGSALLLREIKRSMLKEVLDDLMSIVKKDYLKIPS